MPIETEPFVLDGDEWVLEVIPDKEKYVVKRRLKDVNGKWNDAGFWMAPNPNDSVRRYHSAADAVADINDEYRIAGVQWAKP